MRAIALVRIALVPLALLQLLLNSGDFPPGYRAFAWEAARAPGDLRGRNPAPGRPLARPAANSSR